MTNLFISVNELPAGALHGTTMIGPTWGLKDHSISPAHNKLVNSSNL